MGGIGYLLGMQGNASDIQDRISELQAQVRRLQDLVQQQAAELRQAGKSVQALEKLARERQQRIEQLEARLRQYEPVPAVQDEKVGEEPATGPKRYSLDDEEKRNQRHKRRPKSHGGRRPLAEKIEQAQRRVPVYPEGKPPEECRFVRTRVAWRLEQGKAVYVAYDL
jgi:Tfp pilus assembly protein FimV